LVVDVGCDGIFALGVGLQSADFVEVGADVASVQKIQWQLGLELLSVPLVLDDIGDLGAAGGQGLVGDNQVCVWH